MVQEAKDKITKSTARKASKRAPKKTASAATGTPAAKSAPRSRSRSTAKRAPDATTVVAAATRVEPAAGTERIAKALSPEQRRAMIAEAAYFKAERRGFVGGDPAQDWREAEAEIDARLLG